MTWLENEQDMTARSATENFIMGPKQGLTERGVAGTAAEVDESALGEEDDVSA